MNADTKTLDPRAMLQPKLENIISGYRINQDDADWLRGLLHQPALSSAAEAKGEPRVFAEIRGWMEHCVSAAEEGVDYACPRAVLDALTTFRLMEKSGCGRWRPTEAGEALGTSYRVADEADAEGVGTDNRHQPVAWTDERGIERLREGKQELVGGHRLPTDSIPLYSAPPAASAVPDYGLLQRYVRGIRVVAGHMGKDSILRESVIEMVDRWIASAPSPETEGE